MTDLEMFIATYKQFGIEITPQKTEFYYTISLGDDKDSPDDKRLRCGYSGFCTEVRFDHSGKFCEQGFYEQ